MISNQTKPNPTLMFSQKNLLPVSVTTCLVSSQGESDTHAKTTAKTLISTLIQLHGVHLAFVSKNNRQKNGRRKIQTLIYSSEINSIVNLKMSHYLYTRIGPKIKWSAPSQWSCRPNSTRGSVETTTIGKTHTR